MSLADELLADLDEPGDDLAAEENEQVDDCIMEATAGVEDPGGVNNESIGFYAQLADSERLKNMIQLIDTYSEEPRVEEFAGPVEADPEYQLIVDSNNILVEIDNEIITIHKFVRDKYSIRFPELESLVPTPLEYIKTVQLLRNDLEVTKVGLDEVIPAATIMVVSVTASTTQGQWIETDELERVIGACDMGLLLNEKKLKILAYVESRMSFIAPNLSAIVGPTVATQLMGTAGGLMALSKIPACNMLILGAQRKTLSGFSTATILPHTGYIFYSELVQSTPPDVRRKVARVVSAKCTLAARVDSFHESPGGEVGQDLRSQVQRKIDKILEPPPVKAAKPLPRPDDAPRKKRGGRRVRKMKDRYAITELRKQANRMTFGSIQEDAYQDDLGFNTGQLGKSGASGSVRAPTADKKTQVSISKRLQRQIHTAVFGGKSSVKGAASGTASSVAFTPLQGLEIVNPMAAERRSQEGNKYFSNTANFRSAKKS